MTGPLKSVRVIEFDDNGPASFTGMVLADLGADVIRIDRAAGPPEGSRVVSRLALLTRGKRSVAIDLKHPDGAAAALRLIDRADALIEGFRPGVMERLGLGPDVCRARQPQLAYGRLTGWGQDGPYATVPGHDINYLALAGALAHIGRRRADPVPTPGFIGDLSGGAMVLALGTLCAVFDARRRGHGHVVDASIVDGVALMMLGTVGQWLRGEWEEERGTNLLDGGAYFYDTYETADGRYVAIGAVEPRFYKELVTRLGIADGDEVPEYDREQWPARRERFAAVFRTKTRDEWCAILEGTETSFAPVLTPAEALEHRHLQHRGTFVEVDGLVQPAPAPRFSRTPAAIDSGPVSPGSDTDAVLREHGFGDEEIARLHRDCVIASQESVSGRSHRALP